MTAEVDSLPARGVAASMPKIERDMLSLHEPGGHSWR